MGLPGTFHREDIKAAIRKRHQSLAAFERKHGLGTRSVTDALLGRRRPATAKAISELLGHDVKVIFPGIYDDSAVAVDSAQIKTAHRLCAGGK